jgi:rhodanese-related sulfurtransferase
MFFKQLLQQNPPVDEVSPHKVKELISENNKNIIIVDVRTHQEYISNLGHIKNSILLPLQSLWHNKESIEKYKNKEIIVVCRSGKRSEEACRILNKSNFNTKNMTGGMIEWNRIGFPIEK